MSFNIAGVKITFGFGFFAAAAVFSLIDPMMLGISFLCSCIIHECGHILAALICGRKIVSVRFGAGGIKMTADKRIVSFSKDAFILLCGPAFNLTAAFFYYKEECYTAFSSDLILGIYNLLPFGILDGGALLELLLEYFGVFSDRVLKLVSVLTAAVIIVFLYVSGIGNAVSYGTLLMLLLCEFSAF